MKSLAEVIQKINEKDTGKYLKFEWQLYGYNLAKNLDDLDRVSLYMRLAKSTKRHILQNAIDFVKESKAKSKPGLFLWKLSLLKKEDKEKTSELDDDHNNK